MMVYDGWYCSEPTPSLRIVEDADLVAAEATHQSDVTASQKLMSDSATSADTDPLDLVCVI